MGYYVKCPYYINGQKKPTATIVCEDTHRDFGTVAKKNWQLEHVCQNDWTSCPYAQELNDLYERTEGMNLTRKEKEHLQHTCEAQKTEMIKLKKRMKWSEHKLQQKERDVFAAEHLAESRAKQNQKLREELFLKEEQEKALLALIGYMAHKTGFSDFSLNQIQRFGRAYDTRYRIDSETASDGVEEIKRVYIEHSLKDDQEAEK